jgi:hypothetical protein
VLRACIETFPCVVGLDLGNDALRRADHRGAAVAREESIFTPGSCVARRESFAVTQSKVMLTWDHRPVGGTLLSRNESTCSTIR